MTAIVIADDRTGDRSGEAGRSRRTRRPDDAGSNSTAALGSIAIHVRRRQQVRRPRGVPPACSIAGAESVRGPRLHPPCGPGFAKFVVTAPPIKDENPDITDDQIAFSIGEMKKYGVVDSGDTFKLGIGAMTDARWKDFFDKMVETGMVAASADYKKAYTLQFVDKGVGLNLRPQ